MCDQPSVDQRIDLWRYAYSRTSLQEAKATAEMLIDRQDRVTLDERIALLTALVVMYARPFTKAQVTPTTRLVPLHDAPIPAEHTELHHTFLEMRDKVFGHKDATGPQMDTGVLNEVHLLVKDGHVDVHTVMPGYYDKAKLAETIMLCDKLIDVAEERIAAFMEETPLPISGDGLYVLNIHDAGKAWLMKA